MTQHKNLWAPWRGEYLESLGDKASDILGDGCFLCRYRDADASCDRDNLLLWRTERCMVVFNRFPYTGGHLLIAPNDHVADMNDLSDETLAELMFLARDARTLLSKAIAPQGFNLGINMHRCAGAGLPDHIHMHLVPRWSGDTNFMGILGDVRVISTALETLYDQLKDLSAELHLPRPR